MVCASLQYHGEEYVTWPRTITQLRAGHATAIPPVHPWTNRLGGRRYRVAGTEVDLTGIELPTDANGLPIHGTLIGAAFDVVQHDDDRLITRFDYGADPAKLRAFPFPHTITIDARLAPRTGLKLTTEVRPTGRLAGPDLVRLASVRPHARTAPRAVDAARGRRASTSRSTTTSSRRGCAHRVPPKTCRSGRARSTTTSRSGADRTFVDSHRKAAPSRSGSTTPIRSPSSSYRPGARSSRSNR